MNLGETIKQIRLSKKMSKTKLAELSKCSISYICNIEKGERKPEFETINSIANALGTNGAFLIMLSYDVSEIPFKQLKLFSALRS